MTQEERELLLKDLCARLPYRTMVKCNTDGRHEFDEELSEMHIMNFYQFEVKPYLRPMSSMTKEEKLHIKLNYHFYYHDEILDNINIFEAGGYYDRDGNYDPPCEYREIEHVTIKEVIEFVNWLNAHHFDYRGLIEKGLALEAPEGMYTDDKFVPITKEELEKTRINSKDYLI